MNGCLLKYHAKFQIAPVKVHPRFRSNFSYSKNFLKSNLKIIIQLLAFIFKVKLIIFIFCMTFLTGGYLPLCNIFLASIVMRVLLLVTIPTKLPSSKFSLLRVSKFFSRLIFKYGRLDAVMSGVLSMFPEKSLWSGF